MGAPMVALQKVITQSDQYPSDAPPSGDTPTTIEPETITLDETHHPAASNTNKPTGSKKNPHHPHPHPHPHPLPLQHTHQNQNQNHNHNNNYYHQQQQQQRYYYSNISSQYYPSHQQQGPVQVHHFGPQNVVYPAPAPNTAQIIESGYPQPAAHHLLPLASAHNYYPHNSSSSHNNQLVGHAPHPHPHPHLHPNPFSLPVGHAAAPPYPAPAGYYLPVGPQASTFYAPNVAQQVNSTHQQHQIAVPVGPAGSYHHQYFNLNNFVYNAPQQLGQPTSAAATSSPAQAASPPSSSSSSPSAAGSTPASGEQTAAVQDDESSATEEHPTITAANDICDHPIITSACTWIPAGPAYQAVVQPSAYYLTSAPASSIAGVPGFLLMSAYPLAAQTSYSAPEQPLMMSQQQFCHPTTANGFHQNFYTNPMMAPTSHQSANVYVPSPATMTFNQLKSASSNLIPLLPIDAQPTKTRQAYGMDKVWQDEFECLFSHFISSQVLWTLVEVETNPSIKDSDKIIAYSGRYIVRAGSKATESGHNICCAGCEFDTGQSQINDADETDFDGNLTVIGEESSQEKRCPENDPPHQKTADEADRVSNSVSEDSGEADLKSVESDAEPLKEQLMDDLQSLTIDDSQIGQPKGGQRDDGNGTQGSDETMQVSGKVTAAELESDCDSGAQVNSTSVSSSSSSTGSHHDDQVTSATTETNSKTSRSSDQVSDKRSTTGSHDGNDDDDDDEDEADHDDNEENDENGNGDDEDASSTVASQPLSGGHQHFRRDFIKRFRMFIDSAKVRFCCDHCGHGWTSMKGRVVFWYELFEIVDRDPSEMAGSFGSMGGKMIGYCAYKLFGQQCDVCKIEDRFERPMWYPEEVTKVLNNLYNKIGQVYFGFKMPAIDKQRRAGKPKTSHNSSLCQACHDGVCTDRK